GLGLRLLRQDPLPRERVAAVLATLTARTTPRWPAPAAGDPDKQEWLALVDAACRAEEQAGLREAAPALAQATTTDDQRVPEAFALLLAIVRDTSLPTRFRATCALRLQGWRNDTNLVATWVAAQQELLADP